MDLARKALFLKPTARRAFLLGLIVTVSQTAVVFALGAIALATSHHLVPERLHPWVTALSGITIAALGCYMLLRRVTGTAADHSHRPGMSHSHWNSPRNQSPAQIDESTVETSTATQPARITQLFKQGIRIGMVPGPAALLVVLTALALHGIGLGFLLIAAISVGLAAGLSAFGLLTVNARQSVFGLPIGWSDGNLTRPWLPVTASGLVTVLGLTLVYRSLSTIHLNMHMLSKENLGPAIFVTGLGLILGMRHSTDADHVVAISTIVSKQRSIRNAALIGSVWGLGHTITIFIVGALIILFGVEIPPRLGLSMEFSVAVMLILLGILNLTGIMKKVTAYLTPTLAHGLSTPSGSPQDDPEIRMNSLPERSLGRSVGRLGLYQFLRPLVIGLVHGLAGSAAVALLVLSTIHSPVWATIYLLIFGAGTMLGMMCMTAAIAVPLTFAGDRFARLSQYLGAISGMASLGFGSFLVYQLGFIGGLFTSHPHWTPQ